MKGIDNAINHLRFAATLLVISAEPMGNYCQRDTNQVAFFQPKKLVEAFVLVYIVISCRNAFSVNRSLDYCSTWEILMLLSWASSKITSDEHLAAAFANFSIGLALPDIFLTLVNKVRYLLEDE